MPNTLLPSYMGNVVSQRQRLSAIRTRVGLEAPENAPQAGSMRPAGTSTVAPGKPAMTQSNPMQGAMTGASSMDKTKDPSFANPAASSMQTTPQGQSQPNGGLMFDDATKAQLLPQIQQFLQQHGPGQQAMIDSQRSQQAQQQAGPNGVAASVSDPGVLQALAPLAAFLRQNGRMPTPQEFQQIKQQQGQAPAPQAGLPGAGAGAVPANVPEFKDGGGIVTPERIRMVGDSGKIYGVVGEGFDSQGRRQAERVTVKPLNRPVAGAPSAKPFAMDDGGDFEVDPNYDENGDPIDDGSGDDGSGDPSGYQFDPTQDDGSSDTPVPPTDPNGNPTDTTGMSSGGAPAQQPTQDVSDPVAQRIIANARQWAAQHPNADDPNGDGEVQAALEGLTGWREGKQVAPEWLQAYGNQAGSPGQPSQSVSGPLTGTQFYHGIYGQPDSGVWTPEDKARYAEWSRQNPVTGGGGPDKMHENYDQKLTPNQNWLRDNPPAGKAGAKVDFTTVDQYVQKNGKLPTLDEVYDIGVNSALGAGASPAAKLKWKVDHLTGTDKAYYNQNGSVPNLKQSVEFEARTVLRQSLGKAPTTDQINGYLEAHALKGASLPELLQSGKVPSPDTLRRIAMAQIVSTAGPGPKGAKPPLTEEEKLDTAVLTASRKASPDDSSQWQKDLDYAHEQLAKYRAGEEVDPEFVAAHGTLLKMPPTVKIAKPKVAAVGPPGYVNRAPQGSFPRPWGGTR